MFVAEVLFGVLFALKVPPELRDVLYNGMVLVRARRCGKEVLFLVALRRVFRPFSDEASLESRKPRATQN